MGLPRHTLIMHANRLCFAGLVTMSSIFFKSCSFSMALA